MPNGDQLQQYCDIGKHLLDTGDNVLQDENLQNTQRFINLLNAAHEEGRRLLDLFGDDDRLNPESARIYGHLSMLKGNKPPIRQ